MRKHVPTDKQRKDVETLSGCGVTHEKIALIAGVSLMTLHKHYRAELDRGASIAEGALKGAAYRLAVGDWDEVNKVWRREPNVSMAIFLLKVRHGWKESIVVENDRAN